MQFVEHVADLIGNTPLVRLGPVAAGIAAPVLAKIEYFNPGGSVKDRIALRMVEAAEASGELRPGGTIVEPTSGNTGVGLALVAQRKGYRCVFVCPDKVGDDKRNVLKAYGAEVVVCPTAVDPDHPDSYYRTSDRLTDEIDGAWKPNQYANPENPQSHYLGTGPELWEQTDGQLAAFVASQGSGGTISGVVRYLKERNPRLRAYVVEPAECDVLSGGSWGEHRIEGIGDGFIPPVLDMPLMDGVVTVTSEEAIAMAQRLAREEGIFCGISSGCNVAAALTLAQRHPELPSIVTIINDTGQRYFTTPLCGEDKHVDIPERDHPLDPHTVAQLDRYQKAWEIIG